MRLIEPNISSWQGPCPELESIRQHLEELDDPAGTNVYGLMSGGMEYHQNIFGKGLVNKQLLLAECRNVWRSLVDEIGERAAVELRQEQIITTTRREFKIPRRWFIDEA